MTHPSVRDRTVVVTGGAGFVGSHLVDALAEDNDVRVLDDLSNGDRSIVHDEATLIEGDVRDPAAVREATAGADLIFHEAAVVSVPATVEAPVESTRTNLGGTLELLEAARREDARTVIASSSAIYGHPPTLPIAESTPADPTSPYGLQKAAVDRYATLYHDLYGLPTVALRYFNIYGPRQRGPYSGVISTFLEQAFADDPITVEGDGEQTRDFVHVADVVRANLLAATTDDVGEAFNVGTGERRSIRQLAESVRDAVDADSSIVHADPRPGDVRHSGADPTKAAERLGFEAEISLEAGIRDLVDRRSTNGPESDGSLRKRRSAIDGT